MTKKLGFLFLILFVAGSLGASASYASDWFYVTDSYLGTETASGVFNDAWLHVTLPESQWKNAWFTLWLPPSGDANSFEINKDLGLGNDFWKQVPDWAQKREEGLWTVYGNYDSSSPDFSCENCDGTKTFNVKSPVVPEPVSASLFLLGAGALGAMKLRRKKK